MPWTAGSEQGAATTPGVPGVAPYALDPENARRLWELAGDIVR